MSPSPDRKTFWRFIRIAAAFLLVIFAWRFVRGDATSSAKSDAIPQAAGTFSEPQKTAPQPVALASAPDAPVWRAAAVEPSPLLAYAGNWNTESKPEFVAFKQWAERYAAADPDAQRAMLAEGVALAQARRAALATLIKSNPKDALASAVPAVVRQRLPAEIVSQIEERVSGRGDVALLGALGAPGKRVAEPVYRTASVHGKSYRAYTYGCREPQASKLDISLNGIAVDNTLALADSPVRVLEKGETVSRSKSVRTVCPVSGNVTDAGTNGTGPFNETTATAVEVAGVVIQLCHIEHVQVLADQLVAAENQAGPYAGALTDDGLPSFHPENGGPGTSNVNRPPTSWSQGTKKVLILRVDFSDKTGAPVSEDAAANLFNQTDGVKDFFEQSSYGKTSVTVAPAVAGDSPDVTPVYRMPRTANSYATAGDNGGLMSDAKSAANADGVNVGGYDRVVLVFKNLGGIANSQINYGGLGAIEGTDVWVNGFFDFRILTHELGHTYGLYHANLWDVSDGDPVSSGGSSTEYGDPFDAMGGSGGDMRYEYSQWEKSILRWIPDSAVKTVSTAGMYRVYRFDDPNAKLSNKLALKVVRNANEDYWIGYRRLFSSNDSLTNGAYILWGYNTRQQGNLLDLNTPGNSAQDAALQVTDTLGDPTDGVYITLFDQGGSGTDSYLDVYVLFGDFSGNRNPSATITHNTAIINGPVNLTANVTDPDNDTVFGYIWDFGDGTPSQNSATITKTWPSVGTYPVQCTVLDFKGGRTTARVNVIVTDNPPVIATPPDVTITRGQFFRYQIDATNSPTNYAATGLPPGLGVNATSGLLSGTPTTTGTFAANLTVTNGGGSDHAPMNFLVVPPPPAIGGALDVTATLGLPFSYQIIATENPSSYGADNLPPLLSVNTATGLISGTPTTLGVFSVTLRATNDGGTASATLVLAVKPPPPVVTSTQNAIGTLGQPFTYQIVAINGPVSYGAIGLPAGLNLDTVTGLITGIPQVLGSSPVTLTATNDGGTGIANVRMEMRANDFKPGTYNSIVRAASFSYKSSGFFTLRLMSNGSFSGSVTMGGVNTAFKGQFDPLGNYVAKLPRLNKSPMALSMHFAAAGISGTTGDGTFVSNLLAEPPIATDINHPAPQAGKYTLAMRPGSSDFNMIPAGIGCATLIVDATGLVRVTGWMSDGTPFSQGVMLAQNGDWPFFAPLYTNKGEVLGTLKFRTTATTKIDGAADWFKPAVAGTLYPAGFATSLTVGGSAYVAPPKTARVLSLADKTGNAAMIFSHGGLAADLTRLLTISTSNAVTPVTPGGFTMTITTLSGMFTGTILQPPNTRPLPFRGVVDQANNRGDGYFLGTSAGGALELTPR